MKNAYQRMIEGDVQRIRDICAGVVPNLDDAIMAEATRAMLPDMQLFDPAARLLAEMNESLRPKIEDLWGLD